MKNIEVFLLSEVKRGTKYTLDGQDIFVGDYIFYGNNFIYKIPQDEGYHIINGLYFINKQGAIYVQKSDNY